MSLDRWLDKAEEGAHDAGNWAEQAVRILESQTASEQALLVDLFDSYGVEESLAARSKQSTTYPDEICMQIQRVYAFKGMLTALKSARSRQKRLAQEFERFQRTADRLGCS